MSHILYVDQRGNAVHSCDCTEGLPGEGDKITINEVKYVVESVEKIIHNCSTSWKVTLR